MLQQLDKWYYTEVELDATTAPTGASLIKFDDSSINSGEEDLQAILRVMASQVMNAGTGTTVSGDFLGTAGTRFTVDVVYGAVGELATHGAGIFANAGTADKAARVDHVHNLPTAAPSAASVHIGASSEGVSSNFARSDHNHNLDTTIAPTWTGEHTFSAAYTAIGNSLRLNSPYQTDYILNAMADATYGRNWSWGEADMKQNMSYLSTEVRVVP